MQSWSVIVLCYNENENIVPLLNKLSSVMEQLAKNDWELIIINDGSNDGSDEKIKNYINKKNYIKYIAHDQNYGIGKAIKTGLQNSSNENITIVPSDNQFDVSELVRFKFIPKRTVYSLYRRKKHESLGRNILSYLNLLLIKYISGYKINDINWITIFKKQELDNITLKLESSLIMTEIVIKMLNKGCNFEQFPSTYFAREYGLSKGSSLKIIKSVFLDLFILLREIKNTK